MDASPSLLSLAADAQAKHAALIDQANANGSGEARLAVRNALEALEQDFTQKALSLTSTTFPYQWSSLDPDQAVALAVRNDILDTEHRLSALANNAVLQKDIVASLNAVSNPNLPNLPKPPDFTVVAVVLGLVVLTLLFYRATSAK